MIVENVGGAGGMIGVSRVAKAAPDGYQFVLGNLGTFAATQTLHSRPLYNSTTDFEPVALMVEQSAILIARKDFPFKICRNLSPTQRQITQGCNMARQGLALSANSFVSCCIHRSE